MIKLVTHKDFIWLIAFKHNFVAQRIGNRLIFYHYAI